MIRLLAIAGALPFTAVPAPLAVKTGPTSVASRDAALRGPTMGSIPEVCSGRSARARARS